VVPVFKEEDGILNFFSRLKSSLDSIYDWRVIFMVDKSEDNTEKILLDLQKSENAVSTVIFAKAAGHQQAIMAGISYSRKDAIIVTMDGDGQHPPELLPNLIESVSENTQIVQTLRKDSVDPRRLVRLSSRLYYRVFSRMAGVNLVSGITDFRAISPMVASLVREGHNDKTPFLRAYILWLGLPIKYVEFEAESRKFGETKFSFRRLFAFSLQGILAFSTTPLKMIMSLGLTVSASSFLGAIAIIILKLLNHVNVPGYTTLFFAILFLSGIQLFSLGIIGYYLSTVLEETRSRQNYIIEKYR